MLEFFITTQVPGFAEFERKELIIFLTNPATGTQTPENPQVSGRQLLAWGVLLWRRGGRRAGCGGGGIGGIGERGVRCGGQRA